MTPSRGWVGSWTGLGLVFLVLAVLAFAIGVPSLNLGVNLGLGVICLSAGCYCVMKAARIGRPSRLQRPLFLGAAAMISLRV